MSDKVTPITSKAKRARLEVPPDRGRLMTPEEVADEVFRGAVNRTWVLRNVPNKVNLGHNTKMFFERDVLAYVEKLRETA